MSEIIITPAETHHLEQITAIEAQCFSSPWSINSFAYALEAESQSLFVALQDERVVGFMCLFHLFEEGELLNIAVAPDMRKMGIAQMLIDKMHDLFSRRKIERITLEVRKSNIAAKSLYEKNGFSAIAVRKNYYTNPFEDGIVMEKHI